MNEIIFASTNVNKLQEINRLIGDKFKILSMSDVGFCDEIEEPHDNFADNALEKARRLASYSGKPAFGEDSGLVIQALNGAPGVLSARYAGNQKNDDANMEKVLKNMNGVKDRSAKFVTAIAYVDADNEMVFLGECPGKITTEKKGTGGFGYDPIFIPEGSESSFGEMDMPTKNSFSHRAKAVEKFVQYLKSTES